jgi:hypothetical protein
LHPAGLTDLLRHWNTAGPRDPRVICSAFVEALLRPDTATSAVDRPAAERRSMFQVALGLPSVPRSGSSCGSPEADIA